jgi:acyl-CoA thioester hydrolase
LSAPLYEGTVAAEWIDYNGHMNDAYYALVFSRTLDRLMARIGLAQDGRAADSPTIYTLTATIHYLAEIRQGEAFSADARILAYDAKRLHLWGEMRRADGAIAALTEQVFLCVDQSSDHPRAAPFPDAAQAAIARIHAERAHEPLPERMGKGISLSRNRPA